MNVFVRTVSRLPKTENALGLFPWIHKKRTKELPMTVPELTKKYGLSAP